MYPQSAPLALNRKDAAQAIDSMKVAVRFDLAISTPRWAPYLWTFIRSYIPGKRAWQRIAGRTQRLNLARYWSKAGS
jgi:hypothetical protein